MQNFISISRNFSVKVHGHLKILVHLVNNLIESDDNLELVDTILKMPDFKNEIRSSYHQSSYKQMDQPTTVDGNEKEMDKF